MTSRIRRHLSYANVVATMALVFAMSGSALAAKHYLITSTSQISPAVLKKLRPKAGPAGPRGLPGSVGATGAQGAVGIPGPGTEGKPGLSLLSESEQNTLKAILPFLKLNDKGVGGKPTIVFSGVNVKITSGAKYFEETNGTGNLIIGSDEGSGTQTGSNNLVVGFDATYTGFGSIIGGRGNQAGPFGFVLGLGNSVTERYAAVLTGESNTASGENASITGGFENEASEPWSSVSGGRLNRATGWDSSVTGGYGNTASGEQSSVSGGANNLASGRLSSILGGNTITVSPELGVSP